MFSEVDLDISFGSGTGVLPSSDYYVELSQIPNYGGIELRVSTAIQQRLGVSTVSVEQVSRDLCMSKRTLQRRLLEASTSFAAIHDAIRFNVAVHLLSAGERVDVLAQHLGYSDRIAFSNAFKRWTSISPSQFRSLYSKSI